MAHPRQRRKPFRCERCGVEDQSRFTISPEQRACDTCRAKHKVNTAAYCRAYKQRHPEKFTAEYRREGRKKYAEKHREKIREFHKHYSRLRNYGLTPEAYDQMLKSQDGACAVCSKTLGTRPHVDHDHVTGKVRGILCARCNSGLGHIDRREEWLKKAQAYLAAHTI